MLPLYEALVARARDPFWYRQGVPDTLDGRFDMVAGMVALALLRMEDDGEEGRTPAVLLTELFVDNMDETLRQIGIGEYVVGKHVGRMMSALGGRLTAFREALQPGGDMDGAVRRNIFHDAAPSPQAVTAVAERLTRFSRELGRISLPEIEAARLPSL